MTIQDRIAVFLDQFIPLGGLQIFSHHFCYQFIEGDFGYPAELLFGLGGVAEQGFDFGGAEVARVDGNDALRGKVQGD